jgi:hypothetical protein
MVWYGLDLSGSGYKPVEGSCEHSDELMVPSVLWSSWMTEKLLDSQEELSWVSRFHLFCPVRSLLLVDACSTCTRGLCRRRMTLSACPSSGILKSTTFLSSGERVGGTHSVIAFGDWVKSRKFPVSVSSILSEIRTEYHPAVIQGHYRWAHTLT